jgi:hypothetical protein
MKDQNTRIFIKQKFVKEALFTRKLHEMQHSERDEIRIYQYVDFLWCHVKLNAIVFVLFYFTVMDYIFLRCLRWKIKEKKN